MKQTISRDENRSPASMRPVPAVRSVRSTASFAGEGRYAGRSGRRSSNTWTTSSGDFGALSDCEETQDRRWVVDEYNRLAKKVSLLLREGHG